MASQEDIEKLRQLSHEIDNLYRAGKDEDVAKRLHEAVAAARDIDEAYYLFFQGEVSGYIDHDVDNQIVFFSKALENRPDDHFLLRNKGVALSNKGQEDDAIALYDQALAIKPDDYRSLRNKGVALSNKGQEDDAIALYDQALAIKPDDYRSLRNKGVALSNKGQEDDAIALFDQALAIKPDDYRSLQNKGASFSKKGQEDDAIALFDQALAIKPDDYDSLRQKGVSLSCKGQEDDAIALFDQSLAIKPDDYDSLRQKGVSLSKKGQLNDAIALYDQALAIKSDDYASLRNKGVSLSKKGQEDDAIALYDQALAIKPDDYASLRNKGVSFFNKGLHEDAFELIKLAKDFAPSDKSVVDAYRYIAKFLGKDRPNEKEEVQLDEASEPGIPELRAVVDRIRNEMGGKFLEFLEQMKKTEDKRNKFLSTDSLIKEHISILLILRKWNSYTPIIPANDGERYVGGGYFVYHRGQGTVIDPGHNFIENFYNAGGRIVDIHNIILTHAHDDHTNDFEALLTLFHQYNKKNGLEPKDALYKRVKVYANTGSMIKFSGLIDLRGAEYLDYVFTLNPGLKFPLGSDLELEVLDAYHDELVTKKYATGVKLNFGTGKKQKTIIITSDTGLFPKIKEGTAGDHVADIKQPEIWRTYPKNNGIDLLITHIGSIRKDEFEAKIDTEYNKIFYPNHLGIIGTTRVITALRPCVAVVTEFGEELSSFQRDLVEIIEKSVKAFFEDATGHVPKVLPGDLPFIYDVDCASMYCVLSQKMVPIEDILFKLPDRKHEKKFYYCGKNSDGMEELTPKTIEFNAQREQRKGLFYFKES